MLRVLVPSDGSPDSQYGVRHAIREFLKTRDLEIHVINMQLPFSKYISRFVSRRNQIAFHQEQAEKALEPVRQALDGSGIPYTVHTGVGDKANGIAEAAQRLRCDRIVIGTARKSALLRFVGDSLCNRVIERAKVPVEVIAGGKASNLERVGVPAGIGTGLLVLWMAAD